MLYVATWVKDLQEFRVSRVDRVSRGIDFGVVWV